MLNYNQTIEKIKEIKAQIEKGKEIINNQRNELRKLSFDKSKIEKRRKDNEKYKKACENLTALRLYLKVYNQNAEKLFALENINTVIDIINQYKGKKCGPKTYEKLQSEIQNKTGNAISISNTNILLYEGAGCREICLYTKYENGESHKIIDCNNVIQEINKDMFNLPDKSEIIENVEEYTEQKRKEFAELQARYDKLYEDISKYNANNPFKYQNIREGIRYID